MFTFDYITTEAMKEHNLNWPQIPDHLFNLINSEPNSDSFYLHAEDLYETKFQLLINKRESLVIEYLYGSKAFIKYSNDIFL